jgi:hypothetical protein
MSEMKQKMKRCLEMINNKHLCDGNDISVYLNTSSDKTMDQVAKLAKNEKM